MRPIQVLIDSSYLDKNEMDVNRVGEQLSKISGVNIETMREDFGGTGILILVSSEASVETEDRIVEAWDDIME